MDFRDLLRKKLNDIIDERNAVKTEIDALLAIPATENRSDLTADETARFDALKARIPGIDERKAEAEKRLAELEDLARIEERVAIASTASPAVVRNEERTYNPDAEKRGTSFLTDIVARSFGDLDASTRLARHMKEEFTLRGAGFERRAAATSAFAGLVVPQYLTDLVAPYARAKRPFADICNSHPLPASGMTVNISRITTGTSAAAQTENSAASETNIDDTLLSPAVITVAGQQTVSRQALERGTGVEAIVLADLTAALNTKVDDTLINTATTGLDAVTDANVDVAYTDASPTAAELWPKLADLVQQVQSAVFGGVTHWVMHPRRFWWLASAVGTSFPFVQLPNAAPQMGGTVANTDYNGIAGYLMGLPVILDANIVTNGGGSTNEDRIYGVTSSECHLWEDDAMFIRAEQTNAASLGVLFVVYKYLAYTFSRYVSANGRIAGTGLATPSF